MTPVPAMTLEMALQAGSYGASLRQHLQTLGNAYQAEGNEAGAKI